MGHFSSKINKRGRYSQWRSLSLFLFTQIEENEVDNIWFQQVGATCRTAEAILDILYPVVEDRTISRRGDVVWPPRSCDLAPLDSYLCGAIVEIQLHTIDNVFKN